MAKIKYIRRDLDGSYICQTPGSCGYQVFFRGEFYTFQTNITDANSLLNDAQRRGRMR